MLWNLLCKYIIVCTFPKKNNNKKKSLRRILISDPKELGIAKLQNEHSWIQP